MIWRRPMPSQAFLRECLEVDPDTGRLTWKRRPLSHFKTAGACSRWNARYAERLAFTAVSPRGYFHGALNNKIYFAHRVVWKIVHGEEPGEIDHIDGNPQNNSPANLRIVTREQNAQNAARRSDNKSGYAGIFWEEDRRAWRAILGGKFLGRFASKADAIARRAAALTEAGYHPNHGRAPR